MPSREFKHRTVHNPFDELQECPTSGTVVCKASFKEHQVRFFLDFNSTADEVEVIEEAINGKNYFGLQAKRQGSPINSPLICDLPCPDQCIPPGFTGKFFTPQHIQDVIDMDDCEWLQLHRSRLSGSVAYTNFSIYALVSDGNGGVDEAWDIGDEMYTTE